MKKCKRHPHEQGSGVCASCLRDRLLALKAELNGTSPENYHRNPPPPILLPRSVSPYVGHRRSEDSDAASDSCVSDRRRRRRRFYRRDRGCRRFTLFTSLFHHRDHRSDESEASAAVNGSWFSSLIHRRRKKKKKKTTMTTAATMRSFVVSDRGLSPVRGEETDDGASESGYSTESSAATWRRRPAAAKRAAAERHFRNGGAISGFTFCLSPMIMPGPSSRRSQAPDLGFSGELRSNGQNRHVSGASASFGPNRSRKLTDRGRLW